MDLVEHSSHSASASATNVTYKDDDAKEEIEEREPSLKSAFEIESTKDNIMEALNKDTKEAENLEKPAFESREEISETADRVGTARTPNRETEKGESHKDIMRTSIESANERYEDVRRYRQLYLALIHNDWKEAEDFIQKNRQALTSNISELSETFFHIIVESNQDGAIRLLKKYLLIVPPGLLFEKEDDFGFTALDRAAAYGNIKVVKLLVDTKGYWVSKWDKEELLPIHHAAISGHKETVQYLLSEMKNSNVDSFAGQSGYQLVGLLIKNNLYDIASDLLKEHPKLARDELWCRSGILEILATKPLGFKSGSRLGYWQRLIYHYIPWQEECIHDYPHQKQKNDMENPIQKSQNSKTKSSPFSFFRAWSQKSNRMLWNILLCRARRIQAIHDKNLMHIPSVEIVKMMCAGVDWSFEQAEALKEPLFTATRLGILEIVQEIIEACSHSLNFVDELGNNALMLAILHRQEKIFKFISQFGKMKQLKGKNMVDYYCNNILHLAAQSVSASEIPGAALQMQRELQWFKAVENYVEPPLYEQRNEHNETPREMFNREHEKLIEKGEQWMRNNAQSCTIAISLIITAVFAAAFTVPGGIDDKGIPNFLHKLAFKIFVISDGLALFSSTTSLLIFIGILTASYSEEEFLISLPRKLIIGFITMFISIASMMVAFGATIYMVSSNPWKWIIIPLGCIPVTIFARLQFPLLLRIYYSTYTPTISQPLKNM